MTQLHDDLELEVLRSINSDVSANPAALARVRTRTLGAPKPPPSWRPRWTKLAIVAVSALAVGVTAAVALPKTGSSAPASTTTGQQAPLTAGQFTSAAAEASLLRAPLRPNPGQYRKVTSTWEVVKGANVTGDQSYRQQSIQTTWVPANPDDTWVRTSETWLLPTDDASKKYLADHPAFKTHEVGPTERAKRGAFNAAAAGDETGDWGSPTTSFANQLPRDPDALLASAKEWNLGHGTKDDGADLLTTLTGMLVPEIDDPELRSAIFTAIGKVSGVEVNQAAHIGEQSGISLRGTSSENSANWGEVLFSADYQVLATEWHTTSIGTGEELVDRVTYRSEIVDSAP
jgi:hypothetical protein